MKDIKQRQEAANSASRLSAFLNMQTALEGLKQTNPGDNLVLLYGVLIGYGALKKIECAANENYSRVMDRIKEMTNEFLNYGQLSSESMEDFEYLLLRATQDEMTVHSKKISEEIKLQEQGEDQKTHDA